MIDWASLIVGSKFTVLALFYFVFEGNFPSTSPRGAYVWRGDLTEGFLRYRFGGLIFGGSYTWRGLFSEFYGIHSSHDRSKTIKRGPCHRLFQTSPVRVEPFSYVRTVFFPVNLHCCWPREWKRFFFLGGDCDFFNVLNRSIRRTPTFLSTRNHQYGPGKRNQQKAFNASLLVLK